MAISDHTLIHTMNSVKSQKDIQKYGGSLTKKNNIIFTLGRRIAVPDIIIFYTCFAPKFQAIKNAQSRINTTLSVGAPDRNRTCTFVKKYGPEPYASASSATGAY